MNHVWIIFITFSFQYLGYLVYSENLECLSPRTWQVGNTIYENFWLNGRLYVYAKCSVPGIMLHGYPWNLCTNGQLMTDLPQCFRGETNYRCVVGSKWYASNTEYEVIRQDKVPTVVAKCNQPGFVIEGDESIPCYNWAAKTQQSLPQCRNSTVTNHFEACGTGRIWRTDDYKFETRWASNNLSVVISCIQPRFEENRSEIPCKNGKMERQLPHCKTREINVGPCEHGKKWSANNTEYETYLLGGSLLVVAKCIKQGYEISGDRSILCEHGMVPTTLPQCKYRIAYCTDLPEPENGNKSCSANAPAVGSNCNFTCKATHFIRGARVRYCTENRQWSGNAASCRIRTECPPPPPLVNGTVVNCSPQRILRFGDSCNFQCNAGLKLVGPSKLACKSNGKLQDDKNSETFPKCVVSYDEKSYDHITKKPIIAPQRNPCHHNKGGCDHKCKVVSGVVKCSCNEGFLLRDDLKTCQEIIPHVLKKPERKVISSLTNVYSIHGGVREILPMYNDACNFENGGCYHYCNDENGTIECSCSKGYELQQDNKTCKDINECLLENFGCSDTCENTQGSAYCSCSRGFKLKGDGKNCTDIDECANEGLNNCNQNCHNTEGGYTCSCHSGYNLINEFNCEDIDECLLENFGCSDSCINKQGSASCSCPRGFKLKSDGKYCTDIDECVKEDTNNCNQKCHNTNGSYTCSCQPGYVLINDFKCEGCRINSYRSSSDTACVDCPSNSHTNAEGKTSLKDCLCNSGFHGNISNDESCRDINECDSGNFGCSDNCINTLGSAYCSCPQGFHVQEDQKTCIDVDECSVKNGGCQGICHNSIGSFRCTCKAGYTISAIDSYSCDDVDECKEDNGGCSQECINFLGSYQCSCTGDSHLGGDRKTCQTLYCPEVPVPYHSRLICFPERNKTAKTEYKSGQTSHSAKLPVDTLCKIKCDSGYTIEESSKAITCQKNGTWNNTVDECKVSQCPPLAPPKNGNVHPPECKKGSRTVKEKCYFTCNEGFRMKDHRSIFQCKNNLQWNHKMIPNCEPEKITPYITCPSDVIVDLLPDQNSSNVILNDPKTNMEEIQVVPDWVDFGRPIVFPAGKTDIDVIAKSTILKTLTTSCKLSVSVLDKEYPEFLECPTTMDVSGSNVDGAIVYWEEPLAIDNVGIKSIIKNTEPNSTLFPGIHIVEYIAEDFAGNSVRCAFEVNVTSTECSDLADPENGEANCLDWVYGKLCEPSCNLNYTRRDNDTQFYVCDDSGTWAPSNVIPPCLPECENEEIWSQELERCIYIEMNSTDTNSV